MTELETRLDELGARLAYPPTPALAPAVMRRVGSLGAHRRRPRLRALAVTLALVAVAAAAVLAASPGARSALRHWLEIGGVRIVRTDDLPVTPLRATPYFGERVSLGEARRRVPFRILLPTLDGFDPPDEVYVRTLPPGGAVTLVYGSLRQPHLALSEWRGLTIEPVLIKVLGDETRAERVSVGGAPGLWLSGAPHAVVTRVGREESEEVLYLAGSVLIWERNGRSFRIEASIARDDAIRIAESLR